MIKHELNNDIYPPNTQQTIPRLCLCSPEYLIVENIVPNISYNHPQHF